MSGSNNHKPWIGLERCPVLVARKVKFGTGTRRSSFVSNESGETRARRTSVCLLVLVKSVLDCLTAYQSP
ncbi:hypothetical protein JTB14_026800 [Gonioctena quinquepunctata]|nr:hypothetical protein JTB14_026800 [Gonioctena quinquepunctata]